MLIRKGGCLQTPAKGFTLLRKKDGFVSNVGGLSFSQSIEDKSSFIIGTEAGSILRAYMPGISLDRKQKVLFEQKLEGIILVSSNYINHHILLSFKNQFNFLHIFQPILVMIIFPKLFCKNFIIL